MTKVEKIIGIDISKLTFDVNYIDSKGREVSKQYEQSAKGIANFIKSIDSTYHCVMEATGIYHTRLTHILHKECITASVINPLVIKNFAKTLMVRTKTDAKDAQLIRKYAETMPDVPIWEPVAEYYEELQQLYTYVEGLEKQLQICRNQLESITHRAVKSKRVEKGLKEQIKRLEKEIDKVMDDIEKLLQEHLKEKTKSLRSIPGIGKRTSIVILVATAGMDNFIKSKQLSSYFGLCPRIYNSGTSVKGKGRICKMELSWARKMLYMSSLSASQYNPMCKEMYQRLLSRGKSKMEALIAVANKLLKQAFAIVKNKQVFDKNFHQKLAF